MAVGTFLTHYDAIKMPVFTMGGWVDQYFRFGEPANIEVSRTGPGPSTGSGRIWPRRFIRAAGSLGLPADLGGVVGVVGGRPGSLRRIRNSNPNAQ